MEQSHFVLSVAEGAEICHRVAVVIPAYNEARFIGSVVLMARQHVDTVIVVDDGSTDQTVAIARQAGAIVLEHEENLGKGAALNTGFDYARKLEAIDVVVTIDGDGQHLPEEILDVARPILNGETDIVIGSRFLSRKSDIPGWRKIGQHALTIATNVSSGTALTDSQSGFRAFSKKVFSVFYFDSRGFSVESEMQFIIHSLGLRVKEVPISVVYAEPPKRNPIMHGLQVLRGILTLVGQYRPLLFLGGGGLITISMGVLWGLWVVNIFNERHTLAIGYALISVLLCIIGSSALFTGVMLYSITGIIKDLKKSFENALRNQPQ